jgi:hypothetical protein
MVPINPTNNVPIDKKKTASKVVIHSDILKYFIINLYIYKDKISFSFKESKRRQKEEQRLRSGK